MSAALPQSHDCRKFVELLFECLGVLKPGEDLCWVVDLFAGVRDGCAEVEGVSYRVVGVTTQRAPPSREAPPHGVGTR